MTFGSGHDGQLASSPFVAQLVACKNSLRISDAITNQPPPPTTIQGGAASEGRWPGEHALRGPLLQLLPAGCRCAPLAQRQRARASPLSHRVSYETHASISCFCHSRARTAMAPQLFVDNYLSHEFLTRLSFSEAMPEKAANSWRS